MARCLLRVRPAPLEPEDAGGRGISAHFQPLEEALPGQIGLAQRDEHGWDQGQGNDHRPVHLAITQELAGCLGDLADIEASADRRDLGADFVAKVALPSDRAMTDRIARRFDGSLGESLFANEPG